MFYLLKTVESAETTCLNYLTMLTFAIDRIPQILKAEFMEAVENAKPPENPSNKS